MSLTKVSYSMINGDPVNVLDFGATGDGVTDDTAAIQAALDYAKTTAKAVYVPAGTYVISGSGLTYSSGGQGGILIEGVSTSDTLYNKGSVFKYTGTESCLTLSGTVVSTKITGITFLGINGNGAVGINIDNAWYVDIDQCVFRYLKGTGEGAGVYIHYTGSGYFAGVTTIRNCYISDCYVGVLTDKTDINVVRLENCLFFTNTFGFCQGTGLATAASSRNINFDNCLFESNTGYDIFSYGGAQNWNIIGCYFEQNDALNNTPRINIGDNGVSVRNTSITILGNTFSKQLQAATQTLIYVKNADGVIVKNNWSAYGDEVDRYSTYTDGCINKEIWQMSTVSGSVAYPIRDNATTVLTGGIYNLEGGFSSNGATAWTPTNSYVTLTVNAASFTKIGNLVYAGFDVTFPVNAQGNYANISGLPYLATSATVKTVSATWTDYASGLMMRFDYTDGATLWNQAGTELTNANLSGKRVIGMFVYTV